MYKKIVVVGMGYVGIPAAAVFAEAGLDVTGIQRRSKRSGWKIEHINQGKSPIKGKEPLLAELIEKVVKQGRFRATDDFSVCKEADAILITVQTPTEDDHAPRYEALENTCMNIGPHIPKGALVCIESTIAPGTTENFVKPILEEHSKMKAGVDFYLAYSYERVMVGRLIWNIKNYPRIIGGINKESADRAEKLYNMISSLKHHKTDCLTAEVAKTVENTYRDINIAFANEVALISESLGINAFEVRKLVNTLPKDSNAYRDLHLPGAGVGGHCLPKDPWLLKYGLDKYGKTSFEPKILMSAREINSFMPVHVSELIAGAMDLKDVKPESAKIVLLGLAFLENTDDTRNSPTIPLLNDLKEKGFKNVIVHDPYVQEYENIELTSDFNSVVSGADCLVIVTKHDEYCSMDLSYICSNMRTPVLIDGRNAFEKDDAESAGFYYSAVGKGTR